MKRIIEVNPFRCRVWAQHERLEEHITEQNCKAEIQSFEEHGQQIPVLGRPVKGKSDSMCDVELVYGARRLFVARHLNVPLRVEIRDMTDQQAAIALDIENRQRKATSPYERALCYLRWLDAKVFASQEEIAAALRISPSQVSRAIRLAGLPSVLLEAFESPLDVCESWGIDLLALWQDTKRRAELTEIAESLAAESPRPAPDKIFEQLMGPPQERKRRARATDEIVRDLQGRTLFRVRRSRNNLAIILGSDQLSRSSLERLKRLLTEKLQVATSQAPETIDSFSEVEHLHMPLAAARGVLTAGRHDRQVRP